VAPGTVLTEGAAVNVLRLMAGVTGGGQLGTRHVFPAVAVVAADPGMCAGQRKAGLTVVKFYPLPAVGGMAVRTSHRESATMDVIRLVAVDTFHLGFPKNCRRMAAFADYSHMLADQRIIRQAVVEFHVATPGHFAVAVRAVFAECRLVDILFLMAVEASHGQLGGEILVVAILAGRRRMGAI